MMLCIDVGNSQILVGLYNNTRFTHRFRMDSKQSWSSDQIGIFLCNYLREYSIDKKQITKIGIASVVPPLDYSLRAACIKYFGIDPFFIRGGIKTGLHIKTKNPAELGADIIAGAIAGLHHCPNKNIIIIDLGTATTFCAISKQKELLGVVIVPGIRTQMHSLHMNTSKLMAVELIKPTSILGRSTSESLQSGLYFGHLGTMQHISEQMKHVFYESEAETVIIGTGGFSQLFSQEEIFERIYPDLVLEGIVIAEKLH